MNKRCAVFAVAALFGCNGQSSTPSSSNPTYAPVAHGTAVGSPVTAMIDASGGKITSDDGLLDVTVPAGVLTAATQVSVQTLTSTVPNGVGSAYRLSPEGTTFSQPATLTFHLSNVENVGIDSTYVVTQHADGLWYSQPNQLRDATAQTVSVNATHFSDWSLAETVVLTPAKVRVKIHDAAVFTATILLVDPNADELADPSGDEELAIPEATPLSNQIDVGKRWLVNGIEGGNTTIGLVRAPGSFTAPDTEPTPSAVVVTINLQIGASKVIAPAEADIYTNELWSGNTDVTQIDGTKIHADVTFTQKMTSGSVTDLHFVVESGQVTFTPAAMTGAGCPQTLMPTSMPIGPNDGTLSITYDQSPETGTAIGGGTTAWSGTYTIDCPNAPQTLQSTIVAMWWPIDPSNPSGGLEADNGVLDGTINGVLGTATIHFVRE
jgi:hypothetical protein